MTSPRRELRWEPVPVDTLVLREGDHVLGRIRRDLYGAWAETAGVDGSAAKAWRLVELGLRRDRMTLRDASSDDATLVDDWSGHARMLLADGRVWGVERAGDGHVRVRDATRGVVLDAVPERGVVTVTGGGVPAQVVLLLIAWSVRSRGVGAGVSVAGPRTRSRRDLLGG
jgi:hypothetical protein